MKIKDGEFVMPGDKLAIIEQFIPGDGTYDDDGTIKSTVLGNVAINPKKKTLSVKSKSGQPAVLKVGDYIYGQVTDVKPQRVAVNIDRNTDTTRPLALPYMGSIHISKAKKGYLDKLTDAFRIGDIIKAEVIKVNGENIDLSTTSPDTGVLKAMCTRCRGFMHTTGKNNELQCNVCNKKEKREVSNEYVNK